MDDLGKKMNRRLTIRKALCIVAGILLTLVCSAELTFNVYANALKYQLNYTQSEVSLSSSMLSVGAYLAIPPGILYDRVGVRWNFTIGAILAFSGYGLLYMAILMRKTFTNYSGLVALFHCLSGHGMQFMTFTSLVVNVNNVPIKHRGKISSAIAVAFSGGAVVLALVYSKLIARDNTVPLDEQAFDKFILCIPISLVVVYVLAMLLIRPLGKPDGADDAEKSSSEEKKCALETADDCDGETKMTHKEGDTIRQLDAKDSASLLDIQKSNFQMSNGTLSKSLHMSSFNSLASSQVIAEVIGEPHSHEAHGTSKNLKEQMLTLLKNLKLANVHLAFWCFSLSFSVDLLCIYCSTAFIHAVGLDEHVLFFTTISLVIALFLNFFICVVGDVLFSKFNIRHSTIILVLNVAMFATQIPLIFLSDNYYVLATCVTLAICFGETLYAMTPTLLSIRLGGREFGLVWATYMTASGFVSVAVLKSFGAIYDSYIDTTVTHECFGIHCLTMTFVMTSILSFLGSAAALVLFLRGW